VAAFDLVIFDCDGVLVDSEHLVNEVEAHVMARLGLALSPEDARASFMGRTVEEVVAILESRIDARLPAAWTYDWAMATALGFVRGLRPVPGVADVVDLLARRGIATCVASQSPRPRVDLSLAVTGLAARFDDRVSTASVVPRGKPAPDLFLFAAARMGVDPARAAVVEDSPSGVVAAVGAGMTVFGYAAREDAADLAAAGATTFAAMDALPALLDGARPRTASSDAAARLRRVYGAFAAGDPAPMAEFLGPDVVYHLPGRHLGGGILRGRDAVLARVALAAAECEAPPRIELLATAAGGEHVVSIERFSARRAGRALAQEVAVVWRLDGERCAEIWSSFPDQQLCDRFWDHAG
jgi:HAD superfamily hydrolase (TIGR01509 family)